MSRRRGEFEHRTSIFEGAFRAWSHLGGLLPEDLENMSTTDLDPLTNPIENDPRLSGTKRGTFYNPDGTSTRNEYPYEPLPRSGLAHPYVQAILSPWLGPDADNEAIQLGLTTLRTWWQHRRKGESGSATAALGTEKMKGVVEGYTRHFFTLAHCLVMNDREQPPRTLHSKMKELEKLRSKRNKKRAREEEAGKVVALALNSAAPAVAAAAKGSSGAGGAFDHHGGGATTAQAGIRSDLTDSNLSPLERLHAAQRRQLMESEGFHAPGGQPDGASMPLIHIKGKCIPGKVDLAGVVDAVNFHATQLAHRGSLPMIVPSSSTSGAVANVANSGGHEMQQMQQQQQQPQYGDPNLTPVVFVSGNGDIQIAMSVDGITCAHCVKIVETVLKGCNGNKSPIDGLLDAAADRVLNSVLIKIDKAGKAKRIAFEAARNLAMVGYTAKTKEMSIVGAGADEKATVDLGALSTAFEVVANTDTEDVFDWTITCTCPDNGVLRDDCSRHSQMNTRIFDAFDNREQQVTDYMAGCGMKYGMACTCGPGCRCKNCPIHSDNGSQQQRHQQQDDRYVAQQPAGLQDISELEPVHMVDEDNPIDVDQSMDFFGMGPPAAVPTNFGRDRVAAVPELMPYNDAPTQSVQFQNGEGERREGGGRKKRNSSILSYGNGLRGMSITSETTFGRAMSGLSALSIDWENLDDFDLDVDHSAHINNQAGGAGSTSPTKMNADGTGSRRPTARRSFAAADQDAHVSFKL